MKLAVKSVLLLSLTILAVSLAEAYRATKPAGMWYGKSVWAKLDDKSFTKEPTWSNIDRIDPPLSVAEACRIASSHILTNKPDHLEYAIDRVSLHRYFDTNYWYYRVHLEAVVEPFDRSWQSMEPYRSLLASGEYSQNTNIPPQLDVLILMSGRVIEVTQSLMPNE